MRQALIYFAFISSFSLSAQNIKGIVYNSVSTIENIKIENLTNYNRVYSNNKGAFTISAKTNDTLKISSIFYHEQKIIVKPIYNEETLVVQLKKITNALEEVILESPQKEKLADIETVEVSLKNQIHEDIKNNPHLYGKMPSGGLDIIQIIGLIGKLFQNKNKEAPFIALTYQNIDSLFTKTSSTFNNTLLTKTLQIEEVNKYLFFEFIEGKNIDSHLLDKNKELELLEIIIKSAKEFNIIIKNFKSEKTD